MGEGVVVVVVVIELFALVGGEGEYQALASRGEKWK